jgi:succinate-acetate transporter protein
MSDKLANPAPLGLLGFGMTTVLLNMHNSGLFPLGAMILAMGLVYGGLAQVIAGAMEFKKRQHIRNRGILFIWLILVVFGHPAIVTQLYTI